MAKGPMHTRRMAKEPYTHTGRMAKEPLYAGHDKAKGGLIDAAQV